MSTPPLGDFQGALPVHLLKRRKQTYRLRRRRYALEGYLFEHPSNQGSTSQEAAPVVQESGAGNPEGDALREELRRIQAAFAVAQGEIQTRDADLKRLESVLDEQRQGLEQKEKAFEDAKRVVEQAKSHVQRSNQAMEQQRRRMEREREELRKSAGEDLLRRLFPVLDNFHMAVGSLEQGGDPEQLLRGIVMIHREMMGVLADVGFLDIEAEGKAFDPNLHDAVSTAQDPNFGDGIVTRVLRSGYILGDKVLRPAMVEVNKRTDTAEKQETGALAADNGQVRFDTDFDLDQDDQPVAPLDDDLDTPGFDPLDQARRILETKNDDL